MNACLPRELHTPALQGLAESDELRLWQCWRDDLNLLAREQLIGHYTPFVRIMAARLYAGRRHDAFEFAEYLQFGLVGLMDAMQRFDPMHGAIFRTYAAHRITGAILSGLAQLSEQQQQQALRRRLRGERIEGPCDQPADHAKRQAGACTDKSDPALILHQLGDVGIGVALAILLEGSGMVVDPQATVPHAVCRQLELRQLQCRLQGLLLKLHEREQQVICMHYLQNLAFTEIARRLAVTRGRVSQLHSQALLRLRTLLAEVSACDVAW